MKAHSVPSSRLYIAQKRLAMTLAFFMFALFVPQPVLANEKFGGFSEHDAQSLFSMAMVAVDEQFYDEAIEVFDYVYKKTKSNRVLLEKGRSLYLAGRYKEAESLFLELYFNHDLPTGIRPTLSNYIASLRKKGRNLNWSMGFSRDSNPTHETFRDVVKVMGQLVTVNKSVRKETTGLWLNLLAEQPIGEHSKLYANVRNFDAPNNLNDNQMIGVGYRSENTFSESGFVELLASGKWTSGALYSTGITLSAGMRPVQNSNLMLKVNVGQNDLVGQPVFDSNYNDIALSNDLYQNNSVAVGAELGVANVMRAAPYNSSQAHYMKFNVRSSWPDISPFYQLTYKQVEHRGRDPFFLVQRSDEYLNHIIGFKLGGMQIGEFIPEVSISFDDNRSNIDYFDYRKTFIGLSIKSIF
jgi:tetratricopeptide (TPR) repeat protein